MASLYISEFDRLARDQNDNILPVVPGRTMTTQKVTFTTATQSAAFNGKTKFIRAYGDAAFNILFGASPTATATSPRYAASTEYFFAVEPGDKLSVYDGTS
jgi:hypothetical protein